MKTGRVLLAMSGGVDSSVAAILLKEEGYDIIGITLKTWNYENIGIQNQTSCCSLDSINDARSLAVKLDIKHFVIDATKEFEEHIISDFVDEYLHGRTPNPCVLCNRHIKWDLLLEKAQQLNCDFLATGHYARLRYENSRYIVSKGNDLIKDQSYMLWMLSQENLSKTLFPLGNYAKDEIKSIARKFGFDKLAHKRESYEICFIPDNDYRAFLNRRITELPEKLDGGNFVDKDGNVLGKHKGYPYYTIGQRKGLVIALGEPMYVTNIIPETNTVVLGKREELLKKELFLTRYNLIKYEQVPEDKLFTTKIRYLDKGTLSRIQTQGDALHVIFKDDVSAIAPGQSAVIYENDDVVGGGFILRDEL